MRRLAVERDALLVLGKRVREAYRDYERVISAHPSGNGDAE